MKPKIKEILFDAFAVILILVGFSIHSWPSLCFLLTGSICGAFALYFTLLNHRGHGVNHAQARYWGLLLFVIFCFGAILYWRECKQSQNSAEAKPFVLLSPSNFPTQPTIEEEITHNVMVAMAHQWKPPEIPSGQNFVSIIFGGIGEFYPVSQLSGDRPKMILVDTDGGPVIIPYIKTNRLYIKAQTAFGTSEKTVKLNDEWPETIPSGWDRNYNTNSFEIVDEKHLPVFQLRYDSAVSVEVYGIFVAPNGSIVVAFPNDFTTSRPQLPIPEIPSRKAWFKYPSANQLGNLAH